MRIDIEIEEESMKKARKNNRQNGTEKKVQRGETCQLCKKIEPIATVGIEYRGEVIWICSDCYKKRGANNGKTRR